MIGEHEGRAARLGRRLAGYGGIGAVGADDDVGAHAHHVLAGLVAVLEERDAVFVAAPVDEIAGAAIGALLGRARAQEFVEDVAVDHADEAVLHRHVDGLARGRDHARRADARAQEVIGDVEILDEARRYGAAARLDASLPVEQQDAPAHPGEIARRGCARGTAAQRRPRRMFRML